MYTSEFSRVQPCCLYLSVLSGVGSGIVSKTHRSKVVWLMALWLSEYTARLPAAVDAVFTHVQPVDSSPGQRSEGRGVFPQTADFLCR